MKTNQDTMRYYSTLFQKYRVDDNLLDTRTKKRAIGSVLEQLDKKAVNTTDKLNRPSLKKLRKAFGKAPWFENIAASLTFATAILLFQTPPLEAKTTLPFISKTQSNLSVANIDDDSSSKALQNEATQNQDITTTSLHLVSNKTQSNNYIPLHANSVMLDDDSDVAYMPQRESKSLTVIDTTIEDWQTLAQSVKDGAILLLQKNDNPLDAMISELQKLGKVDSLNIISHGSSGQLHFSDKTISTESLQANKEKWEQLGSYLSKDGDILLYGCNVAQGEQGKEFIKELATLTNADIAASINPTGASDKGGDWKLEVAVGDIDKYSIFNRSILNFSSILPITRTTKAYDFYSFADIGQTLTSNKFTVSGTVDGVSYDMSIYNGTAYIGDGRLQTVDRTAELKVQANDINKTSFELNDFYLYEYGGPEFEPKNIQIIGHKADGSGTIQTNEINWTNTTNDIATSTSFTGWSAFANVQLDYFTINFINNSYSNSLKILSSLILKNFTIKNNPPTANDFTFGNTIYNVARTFNWKELSASSDIDGDLLTISAKTDGSHGTVSYSGDMVTYTPTAGYSGNDTFTLTISDGIDTKVITVTVTGIDTTTSTITSGIQFNTQPKVVAVDAYGNIDDDYTSSISLSETSAGTLGGTLNKNAVTGTAIFTDINYASTSDGETFTLTASDGSLTNATSNTVIGDVVATKLAFTMQPSPLTYPNASLNTLSIAPVVKAVNAVDQVDTDYITPIVLSEVNGIGSATMSATGDTDVDGATVTLIPTSGVATFTAMALTYTASGATLETYNLQASSGSLANAISTQMSATFDNTAPTVTSIERQTPSTSFTNADSLVYRVTFSEAVTGEDATDFSVSGTTATVTSVSSVGGNAYDVTVSGGDLASLNATVTLSFAGTQNITDTASNALTATTPTGTNNPTFDVVNSPIVTTGDNTGDNLTFTNYTDDLADGGGLSLAEALHYASANQTVAFNLTSGTTVDMNAQNLAVASGVTLDTDSMSALTISNGTLTLGGNVTFTNGTSDTLTVSSVITDSTNSFGVTKTGAGTLTLSGSNSYDGATTVSAGTLAIGSADNIGTGAITLAGGTTFHTILSSSQTLSNAVTLTGDATIQTDASNNSRLILSSTVSGGGNTLTKTGSGDLVLSGTNSGTTLDTTVTAGNLMISSNANLGTGTLTLNGGTLYLQSASAISHAITLGASGGTILVAGADATVSGNITGSGVLSKAGGKVLTLSGTNNFSGGFTIGGSAGGINVIVSDGLNLGTGAVILTNGLQITGSGTITNNFTLNGGLISNANSVTLSGVISSSGTMEKLGVGTLYLSGVSNTWSGTTTVSAGKLTGTTSSLTGNIANNAALDFNQNTDGTYTKVISGNGTMTKYGTGIVTLSGTNTDTGAITVSAGTLKITGSVAGDIANNSATVEFSPSSDRTYAGVVSGSGVLVKSGSSALTLSGTNTYTGATTVSAGSLLVTGALSGTPGLTIDSGATLGGTGSIFASSSSNTLTVNGTLSPGVAGSNSGVGALTINGNLSFGSSGSYVVDITNSTIGTGYDTVLVNGTVTITAGATLSATHSYTASLGDVYRVISNDGTDAITGTFSSLAEGGTMTASGNSTVLTAYYAATDAGATTGGNEFMLAAPTNSAPVNTLPTAPTVKEDDTNIAFGSTINIADSDSDAQTVTLTVTNGTLSMTTTGVTLTVGDGTDDATFTFNGTLANVNTALDTLTFTPTANFSGNATLRMQTNDGKGGTDDDTLTVPVANAPEVTSINRLTPSASDTNADSLIFRVTFSESVSGIDSTDFSVNGSTATVTNVSAASGTTTDVTVSGGNLASLNGTVRLDITDDNTIINANSVALGGSGIDNYTSGQTYTVDNTAPTTTISGISISADTGTAADFITKTAAQTITATLSTGLASGEILYGSVDGGSNWIDITAKVTGTAISWNGATLSGTSSIKFKVTDAVGNDGTVASQAYTLDTTAPTLSTLSPTDNATGIVVASNLVITLNEDAAKGTGNIVIKKTSDDSIIETIDVTSGLVTINGAVVTINPTANLDFATAYYVQIDSTALTDTAGNAYAGISDTTSWNFTTIATDADTTLTAGSAVNESSMIPIPTTAKTSGAKVNVFDFTLTDAGTSDGLPTDVTQIVLHTSGTADFSKITWLLNGPDATNVQGTYNNTTHTITFSSLTISVANAASETYTLSGYFSNATGLTDNATFGLSVNGSADITVNSAKTGMATGQSAITNNTNAKVDVTATKLIFTIYPSNLGAR